MSAIPPSQRIELSTAVGAILEADGPKSEFLQCFVRYLQALINPDTAGLDNVVTPDVRLHELEAMGIPRGREGLKMFRRQANAAIPDEHILIAAVSFEGNDIIEADLVMNATQTGEFLGIPATGRKFRFDVHERCRFVDGKLAERWAQVDIEDIKRQLSGAASGVFSGNELASDAKATAGARTRELIQEAQRLPLSAREFIVEPPQPGWELGMVSWAALDRSGVLYMLQRGDRVDPVIAVDMAGRVLRSWGRGQYEIPHAIRIDPAGNIWTVDAATSILHKFTPHGEILQQINVGGQPTGAPTRFSGATDVAFGPEGRIFVSDGYANARILEFRSDGKKVREWGSAGIAPGQFHLPHSIVIDGETLYVADRENGRIQLFDLDGKHLDEFSIGKTYALQVVGGSLWVSMHPLDQPTASPGWLVKLDKDTRRILGYVQVPERRGLHFVEATERGEPMTNVATQVRWYRS